MFSVLYLDDDPALLDLAKIFLEMSGNLKIDTVLSVGEALDKTQHRNYDGIISDYEMPAINGIDFLRYIRLHHPDLPFVLFTGKGREEIAIEALNNGADFYLQKGGPPKSQFAELEYNLIHAIDRRRVREDLKESRQMMANLIDFLPDATFAINRENKVISWNRMMEKLTGIPASAIMGTENYPQVLSQFNEKRIPLVDLVLNGDNEPAHMDQNLIRDGNAIISEFYSPAIYTGKGAHLWMIASPLYDTGGTAIGAIESIRDITRHKEAEDKLRASHEELNAAYEQLTATEEELRANYDELTRGQRELLESEARYRNVVEDQTEFICRFLPDGSHIFVNGAYCRYFGKSREEIIGHRFSPDIPGEDLPLLKVHMASITPDHPVQTVEHRIRMLGGEIRWQQWSDRAVFDRDGRVTEFQSVGRDITDRKRTEQALSEANKKLTLLSGITRHDILNQLTGLEGYLELLDTKVTDPEARTLVHQALQSGEVIRDQILFTQQYEDIGIQSPRWQNVAASVLKVCRDGRFRHVCIDPSLDGMEIFADPLVKLVFSNLFENARMHGGTVTKIQVSRKNTPEGAEIVVADDGKGIPPAEKQKIFEKGFGSHTGLGLYLAREILSITGLSIQETGEYSHGARFAIRVPAGMFRQSSG
ncbi:MAG: PAS domain S-box protein [Methanoregula sp.]|uniref:PAS domain S-box protein n=1 Tax=Methanoregula sp. TaxID=2052170 RepID=UPI003C78750D